MRNGRRKADYNNVYLRVDIGTEGERIISWDVVDFVSIASNDPINLWFFKMLYGKFVVAGNIDELLDVAIACGPLPYAGTFGDHAHELWDATDKGPFTKDRDSRVGFYGAIWTKNGLRYVAKAVNQEMDDDGWEWRFELL